MAEGGIELTETDMGSKGRAKTATRRYPPELTRDLRTKTFLWWDKVRQTAQMLCPVDTGTLRATIRIEEGPAGFFGGGAPYYEVAGQTFIDSHIRAGGLLINPKTGRITDYAAAVHDGHFTRGYGRWVPGVPFLTDAINMHIDELYKIVNSSVDKTSSTTWEGS